MRKSRLSSHELLQRLLSSGSLGPRDLALYHALLLNDDEREVLRGTVTLLERLCELGQFRCLDRSQLNGATQLRYRDLRSLDTVSVTLPPALPEPQTPVELRSEEAKAEKAPAETAQLLEPPRALSRDLLAAIAAASRRVDLAGALDRLYELLRGAVGCDRVAVFMSRGLSASPAGALSELEDVYRWPEQERLTPDHLRVRVEEEGRYLSVPDIRTDSRTARYLPKSGTGSLVVAPLKAEAYVYGILEVTSERTGAFGPDDLEVIEYIGEFAGGLIKRRLEVEELIFVDHTSQIHNRRYFEEQLTREIERCKRTANSLALLVADLDDFKAVNDTLGHAAGDSVLRQIGRILTENARQVDIVARYGGEEFAVILPDVTRESAVVVAERIRSAVETHRFITGMSDDPTRDLTISIGGAMYPLDAKSRAELIDRADRVALYEAKRRGKNRIIFWKDTQPQ
jgi:diguanylate cyclase (GGDEF)-like protein